MPGYFIIATRKETRTPELYKETQPKKKSKRKQTPNTTTKDRGKKKEVCNTGNPGSDRGIMNPDYVSRYTQIKLQRDLYIQTTEKLGRSE